MKKFSRLCAAAVAAASVAVVDPTVLIANGVFWT